MTAPQGLTLNFEIITPEKETEIITWLDTQQWSTDLSRRTQHYGHLYNYKGGSLRIGVGDGKSIEHMARV
jgi:hypothetical protein